MTTAHHAHPALAPPGAGIPALERFVGGARLALRRWRGSSDKFADEIRHERAAIAALCRDRPDSALSRPTLIPRLRGLEDSSRFWSVWMTLDHLRIVNTQIAGVIRSLSQGLVPPEPARTAAVKPSPDVNAGVVPQYESSCDALISLAPSGDRLRTPLRFAHPWFGPLDAFGWLAMASMHMSIHRAQIARILARIDRSTP